MDESICFPPKEQGVCWTEEPKTSHINGCSEVIKEDPFVVLDIEPPGTTHKIDLGSNTTPDVAASTFLSQYELLNNALEPADADWTPGELFMHQMALHEPLSETELGPVISPRRMHPPPCHPFEFTEDVLLNAEVCVIPEHAPLDEGPSKSFMKPEDTPVTVPVLDSTSFFPFSEISENVVEDILNSDSFQALQENDQGPSCMSGLDHCLPLQCFEEEKATIVFNQENHSKGSNANSQPQFGLSDPLYDTSIDWEEQASQAKSQLLCFTQASQPQHFQDHLRSAPSSTNSRSTHPHLNSSQLPVLLDSNYPQPTQLLNSTFFPLGTPFGVNYEYLPPSAVHDTRFNLASSTLAYSSPLVPQVDLNSVSSVSSLNPNHPYHSLPLYCKYPQMNTSWHLPHSNPQTPFWPGRLERPPVAESSYAMDSLSQKFYVNYRLWQMYCKVAKSVYASSPDAEALACFFIPVIRSVCLQCPEIIFVEAVKKALAEWEKHSNFDRMDYYHTAQRFMEFEEQDLKRLWAIDQAAAHQEAAQQKQTPKHDQSGSTQKPGSSKAAGSSVKKAKGGSRNSHGAQASRKTVQELAEEAQRAYNGIMKDLETRNKKQSEHAKDEEEVHEEEEEEEEGSFTEYLNELCSQATFLNEAGADIDLDYMSSLLLSDSNPTDMLLPPEVQDNAQNVSSGVAPPEELYPPPQTVSAPFSPTLQPGLCMADGKILLSLASFKIPAFLNQPNHMSCASINSGVPLTSQQFQVPASCSGIYFPPFQNFIPQRTFEMLPPPPGPLPQFQMPSGGPCTMQGHFFPANCLTPSMLVQDDVRSFNRHDAFQAIPPTTVSSSYNQDREILTLPMREIKARSKNQNHSDLQNMHLWSPMTSQVSHNLRSSVPHQSCQSNSRESVSLESGSSQNATEPVWIFMDKNGKPYTSSQTRMALADLETEHSRLGSVSKTLCQEVEQSQGILLDLNSCDHQSIDINIQVMAQEQQKSDSSDDVDPSEIITVEDELMPINEENENVSTFVLGKQKTKESMLDIQEDSDGTYSALYPEEEAKMETVCSDVLQLLEQILNESVDHQAGRLLTCTPSCSDQDSPSSTQPPVILSPLSLTVPHIETLKEISETCLETRKEEEGQPSLPSMSEEGAVSSIRSPCSVELSNLPCDVETNCSSWEPALMPIRNCFTDISETKLGQKHFCIPSNDFTLDSVLSDFLFILDNTEKSSFIEKAPSGSLDKTKSNPDDTKQVKSKTVAIPQTELDQILQDASQTEEQLSTSTQPGAATDYKTHFNDPQLCSLEEPVHVPTNESSSQSFTVTVTQNQSTKPDPVPNDHSGQMGEPIMRPDKTQEVLVNITNMLDCMDLDVLSELSAIKLDSISSDDDPNLAAHVPFLKDAASEIPLELVDRGLETYGSLKDSLASGTEEDTETKEVTEMNAEENSKGTLAVEDEDKVSSEKSKNMKRKKPHIGKQTYVKNKVQAAEVTEMTTEMLSATGQEGKASTGEETTAEDSLCMSEEKLGQDPKTEASLHEQDKSSTPKNMSVLTESSTGNKRHSGPTESPNQCDGQERENVITSAKVAQMKEKAMGTDNGEKELTLKKTGVNRQSCQETFRSVTNEKNQPEQKLENSSVTLEKGQSKNLKNKERRMRKDRLQRKEDSILTKKAGTMPRAAKKSIMSLGVSSFLSEATSESQDGSCNSTKTFESVEEREQKKSKENQAVDSHQNTSKEKIHLLKHKRLEKRGSYGTQSSKRAEVAQKVEDQRNEGMRSTERSNHKKHKRESVKNAKVKNHNDDAKLNRSTSTMRSCAASMAEETAEKHTTENKRDLSSLVSEGDDSERCGRGLKSDASVSKDTTMTKRRDTISGHGQGSTQDQGSDGNRQERKQTRTWTASQQMQLEQREKERESQDEGISKNSPDQKWRAEISRERRGVEEMQEKTDKREAGVKRCRIRRSAESLITTAEQEMMRKEAEKGITGCSHEQRKLQQSRRQCRDPKSQTKSRFLRKCKTLVLEAPQTRQSVERRNDGQKENLTRAKEVNSKRIIESRTIKKQNTPQKLMSGFQIKTANLKTSLEAGDMPSSSKTPRQIRKGSPATSDSPRERRAEKKGQQGSVRDRSVQFKNTEQENGGNAWKTQGKKESGSTECARENGKKAQADKTEARKTKQKKQLKGGIRERWSDRLEEKLKKGPR